MKKRLFKLITGVAAFAMALTYIPAQADTLTGAENWKVTFTAAKAMDSNFTSKNFDDILTGMQPGDNANFKVEVKNAYSTATDWYMTNAVIQSLEDASKTASGGAYSYVLTYTNPAGVKETLYNSEEVGGESFIKGREGLHEATQGLEDYFYLDTLETGKIGYVELNVLLDGETQGNDYQDTLAQLQMNFAVELPKSTNGGEPTERVIRMPRENRITRTTENRVDYPMTLVKTYDDTNLKPFYIAAAVLSVCLFALGIFCVNLRRKMLKGEA